VSLLGLSVLSHVRPLYCLSSRSQLPGVSLLGLSLLLSRLPYSCCSRCCQLLGSLLSLSPLPSRLSLSSPLSHLLSLLLLLLPPALSSLLKRLRLPLL
jgi:hypothetical protein